MLRTITATATLAAVCVMCQGCMNYLYSGSIIALDSASASREVILYWQKTRYLGAFQKGGPLVLKTACGRPLTFVEAGDPQKIVYPGMAGMDRKPGAELALVDREECGEVVGASRFVEMTGGSVGVRIHCEPEVDDEGFGAVTTYLMHRPAPYVFPVAVEKKFRWLGGEINAPTEPDCTR
jgi:hypothetical protein